MASPKARGLRRRMSGARSGRRLLVATLSCCTLGLAFIPAATAKRDHESSSSSGSGQTSTQAAAADPTASSGPATSTEASPAPQGKRHASADHSHQAPASAGSSSASTGQEASGSAPQSGQGSAHRDAGSRATHAAQRQKRGRSGRAADEAASATVQDEAEGQQEEQPQAQIQSVSDAAAKSKSGKGHKGKGKGKGKGEGEGEGKGEGKGAGKHKSKKEPEAPPEETKRSPAPTPVLASTPPASALTPTATSAAVAAAATPRPSAPVANSGVSTPARVVHRGRVGSRGARTGHSATSTTPISALATGAGVLGAARHATAAHKGTHTPAGSPGGSGGPVAPLATTITKIVAVIPTPVWIVMGALLALALGLAVRTRLAALRSRRLERQRGELLEDVGLLQAALLPVPPARLGPVRTSAAYRPAEGPGAGGDFYDVFALEDGQLAVIVGDVSGHGRQALPHTALVRFTLRAYLEAGLSPRAAVQTAGAVLERQLGGVVRDRRSGHLSSARAHSRIRLRRPSATDSARRAGRSPRSPSAPRRRSESACGPGPARPWSRCRVAHRSAFTPTASQRQGWRERCSAPSAWRVRSPSWDPQPQRPRSSDRVAEEADSRPDDMAACLLSVRGDAGAPTVLVEELELDRDEATGERTERFLLACGVQSGEVAELVRSACAGAERAGTVVLEVRPSDGSQQVTLRNDNVARLHVPHASRRAVSERRGERRAGACARCGDGAGHRVHGDAVRAHSRRRGRALAAGPAPVWRGRASRCRPWA